MRAVLLSDIQGNATALDAVLSSPEARSADVIVSLGDIACGPGATEVVARLRAMDAICVRGNMDDVIADPPAMPELDSEARRFAEIDRWCGSQLGSDGRTWLAHLPLVEMLELPGGRRLLACHGSPTSNEAVLSPDTPAEAIHKQLGNTAADVVAVGHLHDSMRRPLGGMAIINPGSVGWPNPKPGGKRPLEAKFAIVDAATDVLDVRFVRRRYGSEAFREAVTASTMPHADWYLAHWEL